MILNSGATERNNDARQQVVPAQEAQTHPRVTHVTLSSIVSFRACVRGSHALTLLFEWTNDRERYSLTTVFYPVL